ncbi:lipopolysaccharide-induced tumor necrosis factor-alpha factor homolog [Teleopsis dalmanni]|uniref:lipopolysaccharide-induced tumor necrosis factor-alpha factor homolog n=1 Tax=Teleopsis dalmanni TaxID=139649 RepID=UPI0018CEFDC5|nr:lipopolysaccharide-induced tumor necrosis factor-alpha factor homolog [Teleopsis dalmanni]
MRIYAAPTILQLGPKEMITFCPSCQSRNMTRIVHESNSRTHLIAGILCLLTCCCCCIPYCMDSCKSSLHYCTQCNAYLGSYSN